MAEKVSVAGMSVDDFMRRYEAEGPFEIIDGEIVKVSPTKYGHTHIIWRLMKAFMAHLLQTSVGELYAESPFIMPEAKDSPDWVKASRVPDLAFYTAERLARYRAETPDALDKPLALVPDLVIEVISPTDSYTDVTRKATLYREDGVQAVWVVDPGSQTVTVYARGSNQQATYTAGQTLAADPVIPGFTLAVAAIFAETAQA